MELVFKRRKKLTFKGECKLGIFANFRKCLNFEIESRSGKFCVYLDKESTKIISDNGITKSELAGGSIEILIVDE